MVKVIPAIISMYRKEKDLLPITHALAAVLDCGVRGGGFKVCTIIFSLLISIAHFPLTRER